jgi:hypothetical protein
MPVLKLDYARPGTPRVKRVLPSPLAQIVITSLFYVLLASWILGTIYAVATA